MQKIGMFEAKTHLPEIIKGVIRGQEVCLTNRNKEVAIIMSMERYHQNRYGDVFKRLKKLKQQVSLGEAEEVISMRDEGRK